MLADKLRRTKVFGRRGTFPLLQMLHVAAHAGFGDRGRRAEHRSWWRAQAQTRREAVSGVDAWCPVSPAVWSEGCGHPRSPSASAAGLGAALGSEDTVLAPPWLCLVFCLPLCGGAVGYNGVTGLVVTLTVSTVPKCLQGRWTSGWEQARSLLFE